jgi:hypothetical protein
MLVDGILGHESGLREPRPEILRRDLVTRRQRESRIANPRRIRHTREQRARRGDDNARRPGGERMERSCTSGRDLEVRSETAIRIHFLRRKRQDDVLGVGARKSLEARQKKPRVAHRLLDVGVGRHDHHHRRLLRECRDVERRADRRQTAQTRRGTAEAGPGRGRFQQGTKRKGGSGADHSLLSC